MKKIKQFLLLSQMIVMSSFAQPTIQWAKCYGGSQNDDARTVALTNDGGYIMGGMSKSINGDVTGNHGDFDFWIVKTDSVGTLQWQKSYGGSSIEECRSVKQTVTGEYIATGFTLSNNGNVTGYHGGMDVWAIKLDSAGNLIWQKALGGLGHDESSTIIQTADGNYVIGGTASTNTGDVSGNHGSNDFWLVKLDTSGNILWQKCFGGSGTDKCYGMQQTTDGGFILSGQNWSNDQQVTNNHGQQDFWVVKTDSMGNLQWQNSYGGSLSDWSSSIVQTFDGGYIATGTVLSNDSDVTFNHGGYDLWVIKIDSIGTLQWQKSLGGSDTDVGLALCNDYNNGYFIAGYSHSYDGDITNYNGLNDFWILKLDFAGNLIWQKNYGGSAADAAEGVYKTYDGAYIVAGGAASNNGDVTGGHGSYDFWVVKLNAVPVPVQEIVNTEVLQLTVLPNPIKESAIISFHLSQPETVTVNIFDVTGRRIKSLANDKMKQGFNQLEWNISDNDHNVVNAGVYILQLGTPSNAISQKIVVIN